MPPPHFEPIPEAFFRELPAKHDSEAVTALSALQPSPLRPRQFYGHGSWGYTVLRTVYTPESDVLFPIAMERLKRLVHYWCHYNRFPAYGAFCERERIDYTEPNDQLARRFFLDVVEDREGLAHLDHKGSADYFRRWLTGIDTSGAPHCEPRFSSYLVVDAESLASLAKIPDELPPLQCPATKKDKADTLGTGYPAWLWLVELKCMAQPAGHHTDAYPGWLRIEPPSILSTWQDHHGWNMPECNHWVCLGHQENPEGSGIYCFNADRVRL